MQTICRGKKLVLVVPPSPWLISDTDLPWLGVLYISSYLKQRGFSVDVCDLSGLEEKDWKIPVGDIYGITGTSPNFSQIKRVSEILRQRDPNCLIIVGGVHATILPKHVLENTCANVCVVGEGELPLLDFVNGIPIEKIFGIMYNDGTTIVSNPQERVIENLDTIPFPDVCSLDFFRYSKSQTFKYLLGDCLEATVLTSRGCPYNCSFCASNSIWQGKVRYRSVKDVIEEIKYLKTRFNVKLIYFIDDTFVLKPSRVEELCDELKKVDIKWHCLNRVDKCSETLAKKMSESGCVGTVFGFESGSNSILEKVNKRTTVEQAYQAIDICNKYGIKVRGQMIVGLPGETDTTIEETADFIRNSGKVEKFGLHVFQPVPGCDIWLHPDKYDYTIDKESDFSDFLTIGKPGLISSRDKNVHRWHGYLKEVIANRNIELI